MNLSLNNRFTPVRICLFIAIALLVGCTARYTYFQPSRDISRTFENGEVLPEYRYYVGGPIQKPNAIVAINTDFTLESEHWSEITVSPESLRRLVKKVGFVDYAQEKAKIVPNGARITSPTGEVVGVWYSVYQYSQVRLLAEGRVYLSYPQSQLPSNIPIPLKS